MQTIGQIANQLAVRSTASPAPSVARPPSLKPTSLDEARVIAAWAEATMPHHAPASASRVSKCLEELDAMFPRQAQSEASGELRTAGYLALLMGHSNAALSYMVREACRQFNWFPTAKQLLDILAEYRAPQSEQAVALLECERFAHAAFGTWFENVSAGQPIGDVPEQWCRIAVERGVVRRLSDGSYVSRALYHGPFKAWAPALPDAVPAAPPAAEPMREAA